MAFENDFARYIGAKYAVAVSSGSTGLDLALQCVGVSLGDEVVVAGFTFPGTINAVVRNLGIVRFADIDPDTWNLSATTVEPVISNKTKAIVVSHLFGAPASMSGLVDLAHAHGVQLIEDCAQALGATIDERLVGTFGDIAVYSFNEIKNMSTGEGGIVVVKTADLAERCRLLRLYAMSGGELLDVGHKCTMTELEAAVGRAQLAELPTQNKLRSELGTRLASRLEVGTRLVPQRVPYGGTHAYSRFVFMVADGDDSADLSKRLEIKGFYARKVYPSPIYHHTLFRDWATGNPRPGLASGYRRVYASNPIWEEYRNLDLEMCEKIARTHLGFVVTESSTISDADNFADALEGMVPA
jgi:perosamine synthetase